MNKVHMTHWNTKGCDSILILEVDLGLSFFNNCLAWTQHSILVSFNTIIKNCTWLLNSSNFSFWEPPCSMEATWYEHKILVTKLCQLLIAYCAYKNQSIGNSSNINMFNGHFYDKVTWQYNEKKLLKNDENQYNAEWGLNIGIENQNEYENQPNRVFAEINFVRPSSLFCS